ncbi:MAG: hypothetical protein M3R23_06135 [Actinomycetota bacterium]|nr:hypothetical protein [Actinomycetota bacterium]
MVRKRVCVLVGFAALAATVALVPTTASGQPDVHYFKLRIVSSGSVATDYGEDRLKPGVTTASGVDGKESLSWSWEIQSVGKSVGSGPLVSTAGIVRAREDHSQSLINYFIGMGDLFESSLCTPVKNETLSTDDNRGREPTPRPDWIRQRDPVRVSGGALRVGTGLIQFAGCLHSFSEHGLDFIDGASGDDARVPRGAFNPRFDRSFNDTYASSVNLGREHETSDPNSAHTFVGNSQLKVKIKAVGEEQYRKRGRGYHDTPRGHSASFGS